MLNGLRIRKSFKVAPGVRINIGKKSVGISAGVRGAHVSTNTRTGTRATVGIPGSGISYSTKIGAKNPRATQLNDQVVFSGYIINCDRCQSDLTLPPFTDSATVFICPHCKATMQLSPQLQAELIASAVDLQQGRTSGNGTAVPPSTWLPSSQNVQHRWTDADNSDDKDQRAAGVVGFWVGLGCFVFVLVTGYLLFRP